MLRRTAPPCWLAYSVGAKAPILAVWPELVIVLAPGFDQVARFGEPEEKGRVGLGILRDLKGNIRTLGILRSRSLLLQQPKSRLIGLDSKILFAGKLAPPAGFEPTAPGLGTYSRYNPRSPVLLRTIVGLVGSDNDRYVS